MALTSLAQSSRTIRPNSSRKISLAIGALMVLMFSKFFYLASLTFYYTFYLLSRIHISVPKFTRAVS